MAATADDFTNPEVPTNMREFYMLYWQDRHNLNDKLDSIRETQVESDEILADHMQKFNDWVKCHESEKTINLKKLERHDEKIDQLEKRVTTWSLSNTLIAIGAFVSSLFLKGS